jgi:hypothetical protein
MHFALILALYAVYMYKHVANYHMIVLLSTNNH